MKKLQYESVNEFKRNGCFTNSGFKTFGNMMIGRVACTNRDEVTRFFDLVMFRDRTTGEFPFKDLFVGGKKVVFTGRFNTREYNGKQYDEIVVSDMHENVQREVEVPDEDPRQPRREAPASAAPAPADEPEDLPSADDFLEGAPLPKGFGDDEDLDF